jgi:hypothetical protein
MSRVRSPNYPLFSLPEALDRVRKIHAKENHLAAPREVIAKHLGYGGINGASAKAVSAIVKYGLLEEAGGDKVKVSPLALSILFPKDDREKAAAILRAAYSPALFSDIQSEWEGHQPSDDSLRSFLIRRNFAADALDRVILSYRETMALVSPKVGTYTPEAASVERSETEPSSMQMAPAASLPPAQPAPQIGKSEPWRVSLAGGAVEGAFRLDNAADAEQLISALTAFKIFLAKAKADES